MALHGDAIKAREAGRASVAKAEASAAAAKLDNYKLGEEKQEAYRKWTASHMPVKGDDKARNTAKVAAFDSSLHLIGDVLTRAIPNYKMDPANLTASQLNMIYGEFNNNYDSNKYKGSGFLDFRKKGADNTMLLMLAKDLLKQVPEAEKKVILNKIKKELKPSNTGLGSAARPKAVSPLEGGNYGNSLGALRIKNNPDIVRNRTEG
jgi:hypothetical protein